jgi:hypothetical protein
MAGAGVDLGVSGHRRLLDPDACRPLIDRVLDGIDEPGDLVSSLAEGADRLVAARALQRGWRLVVVLPLDVDDYARDFSGEDSRRAFDELLDAASEVEKVGSAQRPEAYRAAGRRMLDRVDGLVAVWDGRPARGVGGTAEVVEHARSEHLPLAWIVEREPPELRLEGWPWAS